MDDRGDNYDYKTPAPWGTEVAAMRNLGPKRVFEDVVQLIRIDLAKGRLKAGERLPSSHELAEHHGVGRGSIREAIRALELFGLVEVKRGRDGGVFLTADAQQLAKASFVPRPNLRVSIADSIEFRKALEPKAAGLAAERATKSELDLLRASIVTMEKDLKSGEAFVESNLVFHNVLANATRNPYFQESIPSFLSRPEVVGAAMKSELIERTLTCFFHKRIADAVERRQADMAELWMLGHLSQIQDDLAHANELVGST